MRTRCEFGTLAMSGWVCMTALTESKGIPTTQNITPEDPPAINATNILLETRLGKGLGTPSPTLVLEPWWCDWAAAAVALGVDAAVVEVAVAELVTGEPEDAGDCDAFVRR